MGCKLIAYYRVSTQGQGKSGLGLEAQREAVEQYAKSSGCEVIASYCEIESRKLSNRPELTKALSHAKRSKAKLVIAKIDRLSGNVHFLSGLMESGVKFVACDNPTANELTIHILAAVAQDEVKRISQRTKDALSALKARGVKLGGNRENAHKFSDVDRTKAGAVAGETHKRNADDAYADLVDQMAELRAGGLSQQGIADRLNNEGHTTRSGKPWNQVQVGRVLKRIGKG